METRCMLSTTASKWRVREDTTNLFPLENTAEMQVSDWVRYHSELTKFKMLRRAHTVAENCDCRRIR